MIFAGYDPTSFVTLSIVLAVMSGETNDLHDRKRARIESMTAAEKELLQAKQKRFARLDPAEQDRLRQLHREAAMAPELMATLRKYFEWLKTLPASDVAALAELPIEQRIERIKQLRQDQDAQRVQRAGSQHVSHTDIRTILLWLDRYLEAHQEEILNRINSKAKREIKRIRNPWHRKFRLLVLAQESGFEPDISATKERQLMNQLSPRARRHLENVADSNERRKIFFRWVQSAVMFRIDHRGNRRQPTPAELQQFFREELSAAEREQLETMDQRYFTSELQRRYLQRQQVRPFPDRRPRHPVVPPLR